MKDTQDNAPTVKKNLEKVGITNLKTLLVTMWKGKKFVFAADTQITIDLDKAKKGIHMSRLIESIAEAVEAETRKTQSSMEEIQKKILERLEKKHHYKKAQITFKTDLFTEKLTPATKKETVESHTVWVTLIKDSEGIKKELKVRVLGNTSCPHSQETCGKPHIQRAIAHLTVKSDYSYQLALEDMIDVCEKSFSSEVYTLLKTKDEVVVVEKMHENPMFVEDVVRHILDLASKKFPDTKISAKVVSQESIHRHDVIAQGSV